MRGSARVRALPASRPFRLHSTHIGHPKRNHPPSTRTARKSRCSRQAERANILCKPALRSPPPPEHDNEQERKQNQRIEKKDRLFRLKRRSQNPFMQRSAPRKVGR